MLRVGLGKAMGVAVSHAPRPAMAALPLSGSKRLTGSLAASLVASVRNMRPMLVRRASSGASAGAEPAGEPERERTAELVGEATEATTVVAAGEEARRGMAPDSGLWETDEESRARMAMWERAWDATVAPAWTAFAGSEIGRASLAAARAVFDSLFEYKPLGRGRPMGFSPGKVKLDKGRLFSKWNLPKALEFLALELPLPKFGFDLAPPVTEETLFRFMASMQEFGSVFSHARDTDEKTRHLVLARMLQEVLTPYTHLSINIGKKLAGRYAEGPVQFSIGPPTFPPHMPAIVVVSAPPSGFDKARGMLFVQLHAAFERNTVNRKYYDRLFGVVTDTRHWWFYIYDPLAHQFYESELILVNDFFDTPSIEALLCALNQVMAEANVIVSSNRVQDDDVKHAAEAAVQAFQPFGGKRQAL